MSLEEGRVVDDGGQQGGEGPQQQGGEELSDDGVLPKQHVSQSEKKNQHTTNRPMQTERLTLRYSTGLVTLNLSMVEMMMAGVVRKKSRRKRMTLMMKQRIHQEIPPSDRCSLCEDSGTGQPGGGRRCRWAGPAPGLTSGRSAGRARTKRSSCKRGARR